MHSKIKVRIQKKISLIITKLRKIMARMGRKLKMIHVLKKNIPVKQYKAILSYYVIILISII